MAKDAVVGSAKGKQTSTSQTMYTPVFYTPSQANAIASSSTNGKESRKGKEREKVAIPNLSSANLKRLEALSKRHIALQDVFEEVPDSRSNSERSFKGNEHEIDIQRDLEAGLELKIANNPRIRYLRSKVAAAREDAQNNTAHGKWELVSRLLHLGITSGGKRWVGARADGVPPVDIGKEFKARGLGWCNAKTEEEWAEWERRYEEEVALKRRVAEWSKGVEPVAPEEEGSSVTAVAVEEPLATMVKRKQNPLQSTGNALGFSMSKRSSAIRANGKPKHIADITDLSMPPPSFSESQIVTSTQIEKPRQAPVTPTSEHARQPTSTPPVRRTYGRASQSPSNLVKSPSVPSFIRPSEPKSPSALRQAASMLSLSPSNAARSRVLVPLNPGRSSRFMAALSPTRTRNPASPTAQKNSLKRKLTPASPTQAKDAETYSSFYESAPKKPKLGEGQSAKADTHYTSHPDAQNVTQDSLYAPSAAAAAPEPAPYMLAGFQFSTPTKESVSQRRESIAQSDSVQLPPVEPNLPTLTDLLASNKKTKTPKRRKLRTSLIVDTTAPSKTLGGGVGLVTPHPMSAGADMNATPTKAPPPAVVTDSFGSIPGLTTVPSRRKSPSATGPKPVPAPAKVRATPPPGPESAEKPDERPHVLNFESPNDEFNVAPDFNLDNVPGLDEDPEDEHVAGLNVNSYEGFELNPFAAVGIYEEVDLASPAKSLSSLAGSDSEDTSDEEDEDEVSQNVLPTSSLPQSQKEGNLFVGALDPADISFDPQFASTQKHEQEQLKAALSAPSGTAPIFGISSSNPFLGNLALSQHVSPVRSSQSHGAGLSPSKTYRSSQPSMVFGKYNSQFDVKGRVEEVDRLLGRDLDLEIEASGRKDGVEDNEIFKGWLKDASSDEDEDG